MSLHAILCSSWNTGIITTDWKRGLVVPLWKGKGDRQDCNNYRGVTLLSVPGKFFAWLSLDTVRYHLLEHQRPEQSGSGRTMITPKRTMIIRILALRVLTDADESSGRGCLQPMLISVKRLIR